MASTTIQWTDRTWNPVRGCAIVSAGCKNCYAMRQAHRFSGPGAKYAGLTTLTKRGPVWTGDARFVPEKLAEPLSWPTPARVFVNSMSDLFHEDLTDLEISAIFGIMAVCPQHTFQVLTKRPSRMVQWFESARLTTKAHGQSPIDACLWAARSRVASPTAPLAWQYKAVDRLDRANSAHRLREIQWPLGNVWLGVSTENQETADERIPLLLRTPAAVRFVSAEPLLGPIDFQQVRAGSMCPDPDHRVDVLRGGTWNLGGGFTQHCDMPGTLSWVIVGGESGPGARPCGVEWIGDIVEQCDRAGVACFVKQLGGHVFAPWKVRWTERLDGSFDACSADRVGVKGTNLATVRRNGTWHTWDANGVGGENSSEASVHAAQQAALEALSRQHARPIKGWARHRHMLTDRKGGDTAEWPEELRVRQIPEVRHD